MNPRNRLNREMLFSMGVHGLMGFPDEGYRGRGERDYEGNLIERSKREYPYSFSDYVRWAKYPNRKGSDFNLQEGQSHQAAYSDHMASGDRAHFDKCFAEHLPIGSGGFRHGSNSAIQNFLRAYHRDEKLELLRIVDGCNSHSGFEVWRFDFIYNKAQE